MSHGPGHNSSASRKSFPKKPTHCSLTGKVQHKDATVRLPFSWTFALVRNPYNPPQVALSRSFTHREVFGPWNFVAGDVKQIFECGTRG